MASESDDLGLHPDVIAQLDSIDRILVRSELRQSLVHQIGVAALAYGGFVYRFWIKGENFE